MAVAGQASYLGAVLFCYLDETGLHGDPTATIVGGLIGNVEDWVRLEPRWRQRLCDDGIDTFHATKCRGGHGEYHAWRPDWARMERHYLDLAKIAGGYKLRPVSGTVLRSDWERLSEPKLKARFESPYVFCFELCLFHVETIARQHRDQAFVVYSANQQYAARAGELAAAYARDMRFFPCIRGCIASEPAKTPPLQVADMAAFEIYNVFHTKRGSKRPALDLLQQLGAGDLSNGFYYDYSGLKVLAAQGPLNFIIGQDEPPT